MNILFSIIMPNYNSNYLERAIRSVLVQSYSNWELILVDNHSKQSPSTFINELNDPRIRFFSIHNDGIIGKSRNYGIKKSRSDHILFLDSDDWFLKNKLVRLKNEIIQKKPDIIYHNTIINYQNNKKIYKKSNFYKNNFYLNVLKFGNPIFNSSLYVNKNILHAVNYISENPKKVGWEDFDLILKCSSMSSNIVKLEDFLTNYWIDNNNFSTKEKFLSYILKIKKDYIDTNVAFNGMTPFWISAPLIKKNMDNFNYKDNLKILNATVCYNFLDKAKLMSFLIINYYYFLSSKFINFLKKNLYEKWF
ncbi:glycosyl transferase family protein, putative [Candidatus Pelagibacter sp. IMCC9063]|uniref:glycosyltransferase family 2 protein n=1 Tax=Pelagibacter sp. (strain IMCC9063) TaxID=1002672 RepID=UPI0002046460|nr:glycosyltransferase [Candidatus Pelagibacter sp. IMCC9063]AEA80545.1 glycosyl transferase family protein, putative [Candidatus Pelagibacter sp. IMCC9063]